MSESTPTPADVAPKVEPAQAADGGDENAAATEPNDQVDWKSEARKWEQRAKDNKSAAEELAQIREAQKTEAERAADALEAARSEAKASKAELLRLRVAASHGITDADDIALFLTGTDEETLTRQAARLSERTADNGPRAPRPNPAQREGDSPADDKDALARTFFGI